MKSIWIRGLVAGTLLLLLPGLASAQSDWTVKLRGGAQMYPEASALETGPVIGIEALYNVTPRFSVGPALDYVATKSDGRFYVAVLNFGADSSRVYNVGQELSVAHYGLNLQFDVSPSSRYRPYVSGGAGGYTVYLSPQAADAPQRNNGLMVQAGGGINFALTEAAGVALDVRDIIYMDYDREELNPIRPEHRNRNADGSFKFPAAESNLGEAKSTLHNVRLTLGFSYVPGASR